MSSIKNFTDLDVWKAGHGFVLEVYRVTANFPKTEQFGLISQLRRAAVSVTSNIAEGFARFSSQEKIRFYEIAISSIVEVENQLYVARDVAYITEEKSHELVSQSVGIRKMLFGLIKAIRQ